ncbi:MULTISPECIES: MgtC/SapB family protein [Marinobacter]|jgi:putative Mg2+ transporter-C (MgtC) family protein|uniref:Protein MgtC n=1 Tax=Marinobacter salarius TaxID=1420917 RepID=A0A1W6KCB4_9GAMM|nr:MULTISPECIES: MgtC/SapB family protein [Marinobacter]ARM85041.1 putative Mg(2+) transport ATPase [Marinobacter salarius]KXJ48815.1 MAG: magnesium transporter MgtC [Marinobacter sp. Hex_13]MBJ7299586.1 MgtC/SapB family protein [Marinobacter salarius]MBL83254.1 magnesium transporter MgtC [Marinobacter sp.]MBS8229636.1 MgtC/SapB family protein [Marinobacter salarius]|tara:strand:- start:2494 stop:2949 length:456 start_codon:yes stop_codon:yes gene_type:complete
MFDSEIPLMDMLFRLLAAAGLALLLGLERELRGKAAGLRSHMLVSLGASAFIMMGIHILFATAEGDPSARIDPTRIVEGVIGGIGFLGAGSIIQSRGSIQGITTGASIWTAGAVGVACGIGNLALAGMVTALALIIMVVLGRFEHEVINDN